MSSAQQLASTSKKAVPRRRWGIAWLLGFGVLVNYFDRVSLSVSQNALYSAFGITTIMFGVAAGFLVLGIAGYAFLLGRMEPIPDPA
jgi:hypothetical protein